MEADEQRAVFEWAEHMKGKYPCLKWMHHIPNGGSRNKIEAVRLKAQGVKKGVPDIFLPYPTGEYHGLYIEMKYGKGRVTAEQHEFLDYAAEAGYKTAVCYNMQQAAEAILLYLEEKRQTEADK